VRIGCGAGVGTGLSSEIAEAAVTVCCREITRIDDRGQVIVCVVPKLRDAVARIRDLLQSVQLIVRVDCVACEWGGYGGLIALRVITESGRYSGRASGIHVLIQLVECIEDTGMCAVQRIGGIVDVLGRPITHRIERVVDGIAEAVADLGQAMGAIVCVQQIAGIGQRNLFQLTGRPVIEGSGLAANLAGDQPLTQVIGQGRYDSVRIGDRERLAMRIVGVIRGGLAGCVSYSVQLTALTARGARVILPEYGVGQDGGPNLPVTST
jgi:hypothetical protein